MNQEKIGVFISECRKKKGLTQQQLAELLNVSNRAVSKWERGKNLPDASLMLELSKILGISVNELLNGEKILKSDYVDKAENRLIELQKKNNEYEKTLLLLEYVIGFSSSITFIILIFIASYLDMPVFIRVLLILTALIIFIVGCIYALRIERIAGYYECSKCKHKFIPTSKQMLFSMHMGRTRYIKCPKCKQVSWNKKVKSNKE